MDWSPHTHTHTPFTIRVRNLLETNRKLEEKIAELESQVKSCMDTNKILIDEHQALQTLYNAHERKLNESQIEADQLVSVKVQQGMCESTI